MCREPANSAQHPTAPGRAQGRLDRRRSDRSLRSARSGRRGLSPAKAGFTLLEVMLAVAIISLVAVGIFRFVDSTLRVISAMSQNNDGSDELEALCRILQAQFNDLSPTEQGAILGQPHIFGGNSMDELQWKCSAGSSLFTAFAPGDYNVTLRVQSDSSSGSGKTQSVLGVRRVSTKALNPNDFNWVPLMPGITGLEVRYFDPRMNGWQEKWTAPNARPRLVRLKFWRETAEEPLEIILSVPPTGNAYQLGTQLQGMPFPNGQPGLQGQPGGANPTLIPGGKVR